MSEAGFLTRRQALLLGLGSIASAGSIIGAKAIAKSVHLRQHVQANSLAEASTATEVVQSLKERAATKGLVYGAAARRPGLFGNSQLLECYIRDCGMLVPEWELKWADGELPLRPGPDRFDFTHGDEMVSFAQAHDMAMRGHALLWHLSIPGWFGEAVNAGNAEQFLRTHVQTVVNHYAGQIHSWDVVNEAIEVRDGQPSGMRRNPWYEFIGEDYVDLAFRIAAEADPNTMLVYNDYGLEYDSPEDEAKRAATLKLLERLQANGTPIHALGIQSHLIGDATHFNAEKFRRFLADVASMGLKILITELDVIDQKLPADIETRDRIVANVYEEYLNVALDEPAVTTVVTWGLTDRYTWHTDWYPRPDGLPVRPLPLDENMNQKLAWNAIARAFDYAPMRANSID